MATTYNNLYLDIRQQLRRAGIEEATLEARELVCFGTNKSREELARALNQEFGEVQGRLAYAHLESLFAAPAPAEETEKKPAARSRRRSAKTAKAGSKAPEAPAAPEVPVSPEISPAEPAVSPEPAAAPAESKPRTHRGGRRRKKAAEAPAT